MAIVSKIQYKDFEKGEYAEEKERLYNELITLIENMPWEKGREHFVVDITTTSVTLEDGLGNYLKLGLYYNQKFILYYFNASQLYSKSIINIKDAYPTLKCYLDNGTLKLEEFKKEQTWFKKLPTYFKSHDFVYKPQGVLYLFKTGFIGFISIFFFIGLSLLNGGHQKHPIPFEIWFFLIPYIIFLGGGINIWLYIDYTIHTKGLILQMSRGNDHIKYGYKDQMIDYNKLDIDTITIRKNTAQKCPWSDFTITTICFNDGNCITIPSNILNATKIMYKIIGQTSTIDKVGFPLVTTR